VEVLTGDATKARQLLGWNLRHDFKTLIQEMVTSDLAALSPVSQIK
jgi:GDP-D-mannose dehydratase